VRRVGFWLFALTATVSWLGIAYVLRYWQDGGTACIMFFLLGGLFVGILWETLNTHGEL